MSLLYDRESVDQKGESGSSCLAKQVDMLLVTTKFKISKICDASKDITLKTI
jgi:hypothetical protein